MSLHHALLALLLAGCAADAGERSASIVDGELSGQTDLHGTVALVRFRDGGWVPHCTGTLIAPDVVLTAAHCVVQTDWADLTVLEPVDIRELGVVAGALDVASFEDPQLHGISTSRTLATYPYFDIDESPSSIGRADDIALLLLLEPITEVEPVPLLPFERVDEALAPGATVLLSGYGRTEDGVIGVLHHAETTVVERSGQEVLAGGVGVPDSCFGDSGGPGYVQLDGTLHVWGVTSRGNRDGAALCGDGGIYTLASSYRTWIDENSVPGMAIQCGVTAVRGGGRPLWLFLWILVVGGSRCRRRAVVKDAAGSGTRRSGDLAPRPARRTRSCADGVITREDGKATPHGRSARAPIDTARAEISSSS